MVAIWRVTNTALDRVANNGSTTQVRHVDPELISEVVLTKVVVQVDEGYSWLDDGVRAIGVDFQYLAHVATHIQADGSWHSGRGATISHIPTDAERPDRHLELVAETDNGLDLGDVARCYDCGRDEVVLGCNVVHL